MKKKLELLLDYEREIAKRNILYNMIGEIQRKINILYNMIGEIQRKINISNKSCDIKRLKFLRFEK